MSRRKQPKANAKQKPSPQRKKRLRELARRKNRTLLFELLKWFVLGHQLFPKEQFHGNIKWNAEQLAAQAVIWSWQETRNVTDAFGQTLEICGDLGLNNTTMTYASFMNALDRYAHVFVPRLRTHYQTLAEEVGGRYFRTNDWVLIGFDGSRATAPRTVSNEQAFCAPDYGNGKRAKYGKKKSKGMRRKRNKENKPQPQAPQAWITKTSKVRAQLVCVRICLEALS